MGWQLDNESGEIPINIFNPMDHEGAPFSNEVAECSKGNIYIANEAGTLRYDGQNWTTLPPPGADYSVFTTSVHVDGDERIWVGGADHLGYYKTDEAGNYLYVDHTSAFLEVMDGDPFGVIWSIFSNDSGHYIITSFHVVFWDGSNWERQDFAVSRRVLPSWLEGQLYLHVRGEGIYRFDRMEMEMFLPESPEISDGVVTIKKNESGDYLFATLTNGLWRWTNGSLERNNEIAPARDPDKHLFDLVQLNDHLMLLVRSDGLFLLDRSRGLRQIAADSIDSAYRLFKSRTGAVWLTSRKLIAEIQPTAHTSFGEAVWNLQRNESMLFASSNAKLLRIDPPNTETKATGSFSNPLSILGRLVYSTDNSLESRHEGAVQEEIEIERPCFFLSKSVWHEDIFYSMDEPEVSRWRMSENGVVRLNKTKQSKLTVSTLAEVAPDVSLYADYSGGIGLIDWHGSADGGNVPKVTDLSAHPSLQKDPKYFKVAQLGKQALIISDEGLMEFDAESMEFRPIELEGFPLAQGWSDVVFREIPERNGLAIYVEDRSDLSGYHLGILHYAKDSGFRWTPFKLRGLSEAGTIRGLYYEIRDGHEILWVGGTGDLLRYDITDSAPPETLRANITSIQDTIADRTIYGGFGPPPEMPKWEYPLKSLRVEFASPPARLEPLGFETRLVGFSDRWSALSRLPFREFNNLNEGDYRFEVRVVDEFGRAGPETHLSFTILPPWYRTPYAYAGYLICGFLLLLGGVRIWTDHLHRRNLELEEMVMQRTGELERSNHELRQANAVKQTFLASMSHEIRNPLNGILGIAHMLKDAPKEASEMERINHLNICATHLHSLLGQILDYSSLEAGKLRVRPEPFELSTLLEEVMRMHSILAEKKQIQLQLETDRPGHHYISDPVLLRQILINLVSNAIKYTPKGEVRLFAQAKRKEMLDTIKMTVEDTGPGIPREKQALIFEDFTRLSRPGESAISGTGLGLTISRQMAQMIGANLYIDPGYTEGARFVIELELERGLPITSSPDAEKPREAAPLQGLRALVADDLDFNRFVTRGFLEKSGAFCDEFEDGSLALKALEENHYDLAVLDLNMPGRSGIEVAEDFLAKEPVRPPLFIAVSGHVSADIENRCFGAGFSHFLAKPLDPRLLFNICHAHFGAGAKQEAPMASELLNYLAGEDESSRKALHQKFRNAVEHEFQHVKTTLESADTEAASAAVHKLRGLINLQRSKELIASLDAISSQIQREDFESALQSLASLAKQIGSESKHD